jgi:tetratricopeptide (TPR) repeat protein
LFRNVAGKLKLAAFAMITSGLLGLFIFASNPKPPSSLPLPDNNSPEKTALENQAAVKLADANRLYMAGQNDQARAAYDEAIGLYKQVDDRLGQANVLRGLGDLESILGRNDQARAAYGEAIGLFKQVDDRLGQANVLAGLGDLEYKLGRNDQARAAYGEAIGLFKQVDNRLGQANVLRGLGDLDSRKNPKKAARYFFEAAQLYEMIDMTEAHDAALREADKLYKK